MTLHEWVARWRTLPGRTEETARHAVEMIAPFVAAHGGRDLRALQPIDCVRFAADRPGAARYLRTVLGGAVALGELDASPAAGLRVRSSAPRHATLALPSMCQVLEAGRDPRVGTAVLVAAFSGMRFCELAGLRARDVTDGPLRAVVVGKRTHANPSGRRTVAVLGPGGDALRSVLPRAGLVFARPSGAAWTRQAWRKRWAPVWARLEIPGVWHSLRNFHGTWLLDQGASELDVAVQLGHMDQWGRPDPSMIRRVYGRPDPVAALERLEAVAYAVA
jgi:integrase